MEDAVIVSVARTPIGKAFRGMFNDTEAPALGGHASAHRARTRAGRAGRRRRRADAAAPRSRARRANIGRLSAAAAGLPASVPGMAIDRMCSSGLMSIASAARSIGAGDARIVVAGGVESISLTQNKHKNAYRARSQAVLDHQPAAYMAMMETAEIVSRRYGSRVPRRMNSRCRVTSARLTPRRPAASTRKSRRSTCGARCSTRKATRPASRINAARDEGVRRHDGRAARGLKPPRSGGKVVEQGAFVTAGNASQLSDGAAAVVVMSRSEAVRRGLTPLGAFRGLAVAGCG